MLWGILSSQTLAKIIKMKGGNYGKEERRKGEKGQGQEKNKEERKERQKRRKKEIEIVSVAIKFQWQSGPFGRIAFFCSR
jgi:hypothetical protein